MSTIQTISRYQDIEDPQGVLSLIRKQMEGIGGLPEDHHLDRALKNALKSDSRAVLFLSSTDDRVIQAFAFANICSGLESGGDYLWLNEIFVDAPFQYENLASELLGHIEQWSKDKNIRYMACITGEKNEPALNCYKKKECDVHPVLWVDKTFH